MSLVVKILVGLLLALCGLPSALAALTPYQSCASQLKFPSVMPGVAGMEERFVQPDKLDVEQKRGLVACANEQKDYDLSAWLTRVLADDITAGRVPALAAVAEPAPDSKRVLSYKKCALNQGFPSAGLNEWAPPEKLDLDQKKALIQCANTYGDFEFARWVNKELEREIRTGKLYSATPVQRYADSQFGKVNDWEMKPSPQSQAQASQGMFSASVGLLVGLGILVAMVVRSTTTGTTLGIGPVFFVLGGLLFQAMALYGYMGRTHLDGMDALTFGISARFGFFAVAIGGLWYLIRKSKQED